MTSCIQGNHSTIELQIRPMTTTDWLTDLCVPVERTMSHKLGGGMPEVAALHLTRFRPKSLDLSSHSYVAERRLVILFFKIYFILYSFIYVQASYMLPQSLGVHLRISPVVSGRYCLLHSFCLLPSSLNPEGRALMEPSNSGLSVPRSLTLCTSYSCVSLC